MRSEEKEMDGILGTILVLVILLAVLTLVIRSMIRDKKAGKSVICGGSCQSCGGCCSTCRGCTGRAKHPESCSAGVRNMHEA